MACVHLRFEAGKNFLGLITHSDYVSLLSFNDFSNCAMIIQVNSTYLMILTVGRSVSNTSWIR